MSKSDTIVDLTGALIEVQSKLTPVAKNSLNPHFGKKYADLSDIVNATRDLLHECGLAITQLVGGSREEPSLTTTLLHSSGQWLSTETPLYLTKQDPQAQGSAITYARRYAYSALLGIVTDEDDDGTAASVPYVAPASNVAVPATAAGAVAQRAAQITTGSQDAGEARSEAQGKLLYRLSKKLESNEGWSRNDYLDQIEIVSGFRDDRKLTKSQASDLIKTLKDFAGEADEPLPEYQESF